MIKILICIEFTYKGLNIFTTRWATNDFKIVTQSMTVVGNNWVWSHDLRWTENDSVKRWSYLMRSRVVTTTLPVAHKIDNIQYHYPGTNLGHIRTRAMGSFRLKIWYWWVTCKKHRRHLTLLIRWSNCDTCVCS